MLNKANDSKYLDKLSSDIFNDIKNKAIKTNITKSIAGVTVTLYNNGSKYNPAIKVSADGVSINKKADWFLSQHVGRGEIVKTSSKNYQFVLSKTDLKIKVGNDTAIVDLSSSEQAAIYNLIYDYAIENSTLGDVWHCMLLIRNRASEIRNNS